MNAKMYFTVSGALFFVIFVLHTARLVLKWEAVVGGGSVPMWGSAVGLVISGYLAYCAFNLLKSS